MIEVVQNFSSFFGSIWLTRPLITHNTVYWSVRHTQTLDVLWYTLSNETIGFFVAFSLLKKGNNIFTNFCHSGDKSDFLPILQKNTKYNNNLWEKCLSVSSKVHVAERKILQVRYLTYRWLFFKVHLPHPKNDNKKGPKCKISSECSLSQNNKKYYNNIVS